MLRFVLMFVLLLLCVGAMWYLSGVVERSDDQVKRGVGTLVLKLAGSSGRARFEVRTGHVVVWSGELEAGAPQKRELTQGTYLVRHSLSAPLPRSEQVVVQLAREVAVALPPDS